MKQKTKQIFDIEEIAREIRVELRSILRQEQALKRPIEHFQELSNIPKDTPRYRVIFDTSPLKAAKGLRIKIQKLRLPDENITENVLSFAKSIWHLKDRLKLWVSSNLLNVKIENIAKKSTPLLVCSDLANRKKHGKLKNIRTNFCPVLGDTVEFDTSKNGVLEFYYNGKMKEKELFVSIPEPIPWHIQILKKDGSVFSENAVEYISSAFIDWLPAIQKINVLGDDPESNEIKISLKIKQT